MRLCHRNPHRRSHTRRHPHPGTPHPNPSNPHRSRSRRPPYPMGSPWPRCHRSPCCPPHRRRSPGCSRCLRCCRPRTSRHLRHCTRSHPGTLSHRHRRSPCCRAHAPACLCSCTARLTCCRHTHRCRRRKSKDPRHHRSWHQRHHSRCHPPNHIEQNWRRKSSHPDRRSHPRPHHACSPWATRGTQLPGRSSPNPSCSRLTRHRNRGNHRLP